MMDSVRLGLSTVLRLPGKAGECPSIAKFIVPFRFLFPGDNLTEINVKEISFLNNPLLLPGKQTVEIHLDNILSRSLRSVLFGL